MVADDGVTGIHPLNPHAVKALTAKPKTETSHPQSDEPTVDSNTNILVVTCQSNWQLYFSTLEKLKKTNGNRTLKEDSESIVIMPKQCYTGSTNKGKDKEKEKYVSLCSR